MNNMVLGVHSIYTVVSFLCPLCTLLPKSSHFPLPLSYRIASIFRKVTLSELRTVNMYFEYTIYLKLYLFSYMTLPFYLYIWIILFSCQWVGKYLL